jgi:hypothetical protein
VKSCPTQSTEAHSFPLVQKERVIAITLEYYPAVMDAENVSLLNLSPAQLRKAAELKDRIDGLMRELGQILDGAASTSGQLGTVAGNHRRNGKRSTEGRRRIAEAARARWARIRAEKGEAHNEAAPNSADPKKRTMSVAARRKIAAAARLRWAKVRAQKAKA